jgi:hypothetical protein
MIFKTMIATRYIIFLAIIFKTLIIYSQESTLLNQDKAIICLTNDDALDSQISVAIP